MIEELTGDDIFSSPAECLVNTVNCEGFMGKGLAYRFKQRYPLNNVHYELACQKGQVRIGRILFFDEGGKTIANFPTKDKWRECSRYEYIEAGLDDLCAQVTRRTIRSLSLPPLGCGNGGLEWTRVKPLIKKHLSGLDAHVYLHSPFTAVFNDTSAKTSDASYKLEVSHLVLMTLKGKLSCFSTTRLQTAALLSDVFCGKKLFCFDVHSARGFKRQLDTLCRQIKAFQQNYCVSTDQAQKILHDNLISSALEGTLSKCDAAISEACRIVNSLSTDHELKLAASVICATKEWPDSSEQQIACLLFENYVESYSHDEVCAMIAWLEKEGTLVRTLLGFRVKDFAKAGLVCTPNLKMS